VLSADSNPEVEQKKSAKAAKTYSLAKKENVQSSIFDSQFSTWSTSFPQIFRSEISDHSFL
jgi:hypothetical protein